MVGMNPVARLAVNVVASFGTSKVVKDIIKNNVTINGTRDLVNVWIGTVVIGSLIADVAERHVNARLDEFVEWRAKLKTLDELRNEEDKTESA